MATLDDLMQRALRFREERDWKQFHTPKELAIQLVLEAGELLELMQWKTGAELDAHLAAHREAVADELADVLHAVLLIAHDMNIQLDEAFVAKMKRTRSNTPSRRPGARPGNTRSLTDRPTRFHCCGGLSRACGSKLMSTIAV